MASVSGRLSKRRASYGGRIFLYRVAVPNDAETSPVGKRPIKTDAKVQLRTIFKKRLSILFKGRRGCAGPGRGESWARFNEAGIILCQLHK